MRQNFIVLITTNRGCEAQVLDAVKSKITGSVGVYADQLNRTKVIARFQSDSARFEGDLQKDIYDMVMDIDGVAQVDVLRLELT